MYFWKRQVERNHYYSGTFNVALGCPPTMKKPDGHRNNLCVQEVALSQGRECSTVWVCLQPLKCELHQRLSLRKQRQLKRAWMEGCAELHFGSLWQGEVSCWGPQEAELQAEQAQPPTDFCCRGHNLNLCKHAGVKSIGDSMLILSCQLFLCRKNHTSES